MASARKNWELVVRAVLERGQVRNAGKGPGPPRHGLADIVPPSLGKETNIDAILNAAEEIGDEHPNVARILCEQAYSLAQQLDPNSDGRGVLQFKTGLKSIINQKLAEKEGTQIDRRRDIKVLWEFYQSYKRQHGVDDVEWEQQGLMISGTTGTSVGELTRVFSTLKALIVVLEMLVGDSRAEGIVREILEESRKLKSSGSKIKKELTPYNIVPIDAPSITNAIGSFPEVKAAVAAIASNANFAKLPGKIVASLQKEPPDMFDLLEYIFGFQKDNIRNQRENVVMTLANAQTHLGLPMDSDPKIDDTSITNVFRKVLDNYTKWCRYLGTRVAWNSIEAIDRSRKVIFISLYFLIWGEAANVRFLPECICYIFHHMAKELDVILNQQEAERAKSCWNGNESDSASFLGEIITPIYEAMAAEANNNKNGKASHAAWRNYDDFNEFFWSPSCFKLRWPLQKNSPFLAKPKARKRTAKSSFVEHRTFLHLYRSFVRLWIFLVLMFQGLTILAFHDGKFNLNTFKEILSIGPTYAIMNFVQICLDVLLMFGAYSTARGFAISRLVFRFIWFGAISVFVMYLYIKVLDEKNNSNSDSTYFRIYILLLGIYAAVRISFALVIKFPASHVLSDISDRWPFFQFFKWIYQERHFVGRGLYERPSDYLRYTLFWMVIFVAKFSFTYFLQIKPLVEPTQLIVKFKDLQYSWHDFVSKNNRNALTLASLWGPVIAIYIMDIHIWYTLLSALIGGVIGARARLGELRSPEMLQKRFETFPQAFCRNLVSSRAITVETTRDMSKIHAAIFSPFWNEIIKSLREEDYISNREQDLLLIPSNTSSLQLVQWPLFLLIGKILFALDLALAFKENQAALWSKISKDEYMAYAVQECYYSAEKILHSLVDDEGRLWVERLFREINSSIATGSLAVTITLKKLQFVISRLTALTGLLINVETPERRVGASKAMREIHDVVTNDLLTSNLGEQFGSWNIIVRAKNEGRLFSKIHWPRDPEIIEQVKRLHLLLTVKDSAGNIPKNEEARRRLEYFTNSLFMEMPSAKPVSEMIPFSVFTPYYNETVLYSPKDLQDENEDGITILFYLQTISPDEWINFLERVQCSSDVTVKTLLQNPAHSMELRLWASYRGQTLARTVRGMMYYRRALMLQSYLEKRALGGIEEAYTRVDYLNPHGYESSLHSRAQADLKFTYVVSCQIYGEQKGKNAPEAADIALLMRRNEALRVAFIHKEETIEKDGQISQEFFSKLVKADALGKDQEIYSIKLPGNPKLGEGKPENQNHAIIFTRGEAIQTIDMNQDNYLEEAIKMRNLLEEFHGDHGLRPPTILGVRENVFTASVSSLAWFMSNQETSFVTLGQRVLAYPLKCRMHYGHPDVFDRIFHISRGGISKASRLINISEDIYAGFNSTLRQGNITHHEYIQVGKGRDVGLNQIALFEGKVAGGNGEQVLSRDVYRLGQLFDFFRMLSFYFTTVGYYVCTMVTVLTVYIFLYGRVYLALSGVDYQISRQARLLLGNTALDTALNAQFLVQIGVFTAVPMIMGFILELGLVKAVFNFINMQIQLCSVFFTFSLGTRTHYFGRTILHGGAGYKATGRGFVVMHIKFAENYRLFARSHFVKALEVALLLIVYMAYGYTRGGSSSFFWITISSWILVLSWLFAPFIFNPSGFEWQKTVEDFDDWISWLLYKGGVGVKGSKSWESWWDEEQMHIQSWSGRIVETILSLRFFIFQYGIIYKLKITGDSTSLTLYGYSWVVIFALVLLFKVFSFSPKKSASFQVAFRFLQGLAFLLLIAALILTVALTDLSIADIFAMALGFVATGWAVLCIAIAWKGLVKKLGLWYSVREIARMYDAGIGMIIFVPIAFCSWFPFVTTFQSRALFNQAFGRGLEFSKILVGNKANAQI